MNRILKICSKKQRYDSVSISKLGMIPERIAFASKIDASKCVDVQQFLMEKAQQESFLKWARTPELKSLLEVREELYWGGIKGSLRQFFSFITP